MKTFTRQEVDQAFELALRATRPPARIDDVVSIQQLSGRLAEALNVAPENVRIRCQPSVPVKGWVTVYVGAQRFG